MTGSGKTGLGIVMLEEALLAGIPALAPRPEGDMGNLLLTFPELSAQDFRPWVNEDDARSEGVSLDDFAAKTDRRLASAGSSRRGSAPIGSRHFVRQPISRSTPLARRRACR